MECEKKRYFLLDAARAIAVINMVLYHYLYDVNVIFGGSRLWYRQIHIAVWEFLICSSFIFISGISWNFSKKRFKRGLLLNFLGLLVTLVTVAFVPDERILFGILSFFGCAFLIMIPFDFILKRINPYFGILISVSLFVLTYKSLWRGYIGIGNIRLISLPEFLCNKVFSAPLGFYSSSFYSSDFFPLMPWFFVFMLGYFAQKCLANNSGAQKLLSFKVPFLSSLGRKSLLIYILHQPICILAAFAYCSLIIK